MRLSLGQLKEELVHDFLKQVQVLVNVDNDRVNLLSHSLHVLLVVVHVVIESCFEAFMVLGDLVNDFTGVTIDC